MAQICAGVCGRQSNVKPKGYWKYNGYRLCSVCEVAYDVPDDVDCYWCPCCNGRTRYDTKA